MQEHVAADQNLQKGQEHSLLQSLTLIYPLYIILTSSKPLAQKCLLISVCVQSEYKHILFSLIFKRLISSVNIYINIWNQVANPKFHDRDSLIKKKKAEVELKHAQACVFCWSK